MKIGVKPDVCHFGGSPGSHSHNDEGLYSMNDRGQITPGMGTSFAAPMVAKTLAVLESSIDGHVSRETLIALLMHGTSVPEILDHPELQTIARNFVGFGIPSAAQDTLINGDDAT